MDVSQSHLRESLELGMDLRNVGQELQSLVYSGFEQVCNALALVFDLECFLVIPPSAANITSDVDIRQEIHFNALQPIALTSFAPSALYIEAEPACFVSALPRFRQHGVDVANC